MLELFIYFLVMGVLMYLFDATLLKIRKGIFLTSYILSAVLAGVILGIATQSINVQGKSAMFLPLVISVSSSLLLFFTHLKNLYEKPIFQFFGTVLLGLATGVIAFLLVGLMQLVDFDLYKISEDLISFFIDLILYGFLLHFGYAFSGRISKTLFRK